MGDAAVGKTSLRDRYFGKGFSTNYIMTIGSSFALKETNIDDTPVKIQIWDLAGQPRYNDVRVAYYNRAQAGLLLFDITRKETLDNENLIYLLQNIVGELAYA